MAEEDTKILAHRRRELISSLTDEQGAVRVRELSDQLGVSAMTIRRDIEALAQANRVERVHGGAIRLDRANRSVDEPGFQAKLMRQQAEKIEIAAAAARHIAAGSAIGITAGTTTFQLAQHLSAINDLTIVTNSMPIATELTATPTGAHVVLTGGTPTRSSAIVGPLADRSLADLHLDLVFMGVHGMGEVAGFTTPNLAEAQTNQSFIRSARQVVVLADSTKWDTTGLGTIAPLSEADLLITDDQLSPQALGVVHREIGEVELVTAAVDSP